MTDLEALQRVMLDAQAHHATAPVLTDESKQALAIVEGLVVSLEEKQNDQLWVLKACESALSQVGLVHLLCGTSYDVKEAMKDLLNGGDSMPAVPTFTDQQLAEALMDAVNEAAMPVGFSDWTYDRCLTAAKALLGIEVEGA